MSDSDNLMPTKFSLSEQTPASMHQTLRPEPGVVPAVMPTQIGRYRVQRLLGKGGFGLVYLAHDEQLQRGVAIKVPYASRYADAETYLSEARLVASLDHPNIVPVHDVGSTDQCPCYIVTRFIEGVTLSQRMKEKRFTSYEAAELVAVVADALHYAHRKNLVHRDVKPGNILLDTNGKPYVVDFGLALTQQTHGQGPKYAGTPSYMSPEQARGEGHVVDGRSDIFSLGVLFYELLLGHTPFKAPTVADLMIQILTVEAVPPRQIDDTIPRELERICLKALAKRLPERYTTARDLADELRQFLEQGPASERYAQVVASGLVQRLLDAEIAQVPGVIHEMEAYRAKAEPLLKVEFERAPSESRQKLHASLALLSTDCRQVEFLFGRLLQATPNELPTIATALRAYRDDLTDRLWQTLEDAREQADRRFRAACVLAGFDPGGDAATNRRWQANAAFVALQMLTAVQRNPSHYTPLLETLRPIRAALVPPLVECFRGARQRSREDPSGAERFFATNLLAEYAADQPRLLAELLMDADEKQFAVLYPRAVRHTDAPALFQETVARSPSPSDDRERQAKRQANAAVALLRLGRAKPVWPLLKHTPDPCVRSYLVHRLGPMGVDVRALLERLEQEPEASIRRALVLSLGEVSDDAWSVRQRSAAIERIQPIYETTDDPGLHGAAEWLLRRWRQGDWLRARNEQWARASAPRRSSWYVNVEAQTMVAVAGPVEFDMGSPASEADRFETESLHRVRIPRAFAIGAKTVTVEQFLRFRPGYDYFRQYAPTEDCPVHQVTWYLAAEYCNWLSGRDGVPPEQWCYEPNAQGQYAAGMRARPNYLSLVGYRLPTEAEWEYACRAGAVTSRYFGESDELLTRYGVRSSNLGRSWPAGSLKPNDLGLFDMLGNVWCWCQDRLRDYPPTADIVEDVEGPLVVTNDEAHVLRGGSFLNPAMTLRCAYRFGNVPANRSAANGFRVARTVSL